MLREWDPGSHALLEANDGYVLGRPKIDEIDVRIIQDRNALIAGVLAGSIDLPLDPGLSIEDVAVFANWPAGHADVQPNGDIKLWPQLATPRPMVLGDVRFRRALLRGLDRQQLADTLFDGRVPVAESIVIPTEREYPDLTPGIVHYPYDPRAAMQEIASLGYRAGTDGTLGRVFNGHDRSRA